MWYVRKKEELKEIAKFLDWASRKKELATTEKRKTIKGTGHLSSCWC